jgi:glycosyltransferase involved in cell wall biosynthesis
VCTDWTYGFEKVSKLDQFNVLPIESKDNVELDIFHINIDMACTFKSQVISLSLSDSRYIIPYWELPSFRSEWFHGFSLFDGFIAPTSFLENSIYPLTTKPIYCLKPLLIKPKETSGFSRSELGISENTYIFLYVFDARSGLMRKNPNLLIDAFQEIEKISGLDIHLLLKISGLEGSEDLDMNISQNNPKITLLNQNLTDSELAGIYDLSDCYVSPHRAEGLGLTLIEALAHDCALIFTKFSGSSDIPNLPGILEIEFSYVAIEKTVEPYESNNIWADPKLTSLVDKMSFAAKTHLTLSQNAKNWVQENYYSIPGDECLDDS